MKYILKAKLLLRSCVKARITATIYYLPLWNIASCAFSPNQINLNPNSLKVKVWNDCDKFWLNSGLRQPQRRKAWRKWKIRCTVVQLWKQLYITLLLMFQTWPVHRPISTSWSVGAVEIQCDLVVGDIIIYHSNLLIVGKILRQQSANGSNWVWQWHESESGQIVLKQVKLTYFDAYLRQTMWNHAKINGRAQTFILSVFIMGHHKILI